MRKVIAILCCIAALGASHAQGVIPFSDPRWQITGKTITQETYQGKPALKIEQGRALLAGVDFTNGVIEFDVALAEGRYFPGMNFRVQSPGNQETIYVRPHQSGHPDAIQYYPEYNGDGAWQLYYGEGFGAPHLIPVNRWMHVRLLVSGVRAELYLDGESKPALSIDSLRRPVKAGGLALYNDGPPIHYANFSYTSTNQAPLQEAARTPRILDPGVVREWSVSSRFAEARLKDKVVLGDRDTADLSWQSLKTDNRGVADLSMLAGATSSDSNTVFARTRIYAAQAGVRRVDFGFADRVKVYLNGQLLYAGHDEFLSRDYRFLGTMGYWDALYLPLRQGINELWFSVSETDGGGWGIEANVGGEQR